MHSTSFVTKKVMELKLTTPEGPQKTTGRGCESLVSDMLIEVNML